MRAWRILKLCAINILGLCLVFIFLEFGCRLAGVPYAGNIEPSENAIAQFDPELGWSYIPKMSKSQQEESSFWPLHIDERGIRVPSPEFTFDDSQPSVLFIGGSFTMGHGLPYEESFVGQVANCSDMPYQVVNLGVQAYGTDQALLTLKKFLPAFNTKIVVYTFIGAHVLRNGNYDRRQLYPRLNFIATKPLFALNEHHELYLAKKPLLYKDYMHSWLVDALTITIEKRLGVFPPFPVALTQALMLEMKNYCETHGVRFIVLNWRWTPDDYDEIFSQLDVEVIDTLQGVVPEGWKAMRLPQDSHPNAAASLYVSQLLCRYLLEK